MIDLPCVKSLSIVTAGISQRLSPPSWRLALGEPTIETAIERHPEVVSARPRHRFLRRGLQRTGNFLPLDLDIIRRFDADPHLAPIMKDSPTFRERISMAAAYRAPEDGQGVKPASPMLVPTAKA
jgi:hypothetical protein